MGAELQQSGLLPSLHAPLHNKHLRPSGQWERKEHTGDKLGRVPHAFQNGGLQWETRGAACAAPVVQGLGAELSAPLGGGSRSPDTRSSQLGTSGPSLLVAAHVPWQRVLRVLPLRPFFSFAHTHEQGCIAHPRVLTWSTATASCLASILTSVHSVISSSAFPVVTAVAFLKPRSNHVTPWLKPFS